MRRNPLPGLLLACSVAAVLPLLPGCGLDYGTPMLQAQPNGLQAESTQGIEQGWFNIHQALFKKIDKDGDGTIDEYEASPYFTLQEFQAIDKDHDDRIEYDEFMNYAESTFFGLFHDSRQAFLQRVRDSLWTAFQRLDTNNDGLLEPSELEGPALQKLGLGFAYDKFHIRFQITSFDPGDIQAADHNGDGALGQAEFEDLYMATVVKMITSGPAPAPAPGPEPAPGPTPAPGPASASLYVP